jgi:membrane protein implicated in regulation of membrane protease activity
MPSIVWIWLAAFVIFLIFEVFTPSMIFIGFAVGALVSGIFGFFYPDAFYWQIGIFIAITVILLPLTRKMAKKITKESPSQSNVDAMIGKVGLVTETIDPDMGGKIQFEGEVWRATSDERIEANEKVVINSVSGTKLHVELKQE